jgi:hypothetical protein
VKEIALIRQISRKNSKSLDFYQKILAGSQNIKSILNFSKTFISGL